VRASFEKHENPVLFKMKTTGSYLPEYSGYGVLHFELAGQVFTLEAFRGKSLRGDDDYLFVPFTDKTNGRETYTMGRYIEITIPKGNEVIFDFNQCVNPYCSYRKGYACEIPPAANALPIEIKAGEMYDDHH
jgi:uncharacterized protein (DUF1684 family)